MTMNDESPSPTIDDAIVWAAKAEQLGYYGGETPRLLKTAAEAVRGLLGGEDTRDCEHILAHIEQMHARLLNKSSALSRESAQKYIVRVQRLLRDFVSYSADPVGFVPSNRRAAEVGTAKPTKKPRAAAKVADAPPEHREGHQKIPGDARVHTLSLSEGLARLDLPKTITMSEFQMMAMVMASHCPDAQLE